MKYDITTEQFVSRGNELIDNIKKARQELRSAIHQAREEDYNFSFLEQIYPEYLLDIESRKVDPNRLLDIESRKVDPNRPFRYCADAELHRAIVDLEDEISIRKQGIMNSHATKYLAHRLFAAAFRAHLKDCKWNDGRIALFMKEQRFTLNPEYVAGFEKEIKSMKTREQKMADEIKMWQI